MDKVIASLIAAGIVAAGLLFSRTARADQTVNPLQTDFVPPSGSTGIRNNNPFNLEFRNIGWRGEVGSDGRFSIFDSALNGIRAGMINVHTKFNRDGANTVRKLLNILSPDFENPTENFIQFVSSRLGVSPDQPLDWQQRIIQLSKAIVTFETGEPNGNYPDSLFNQALQETGKL